MRKLLLLLVVLGGLGAAAFFGYQRFLGPNRACAHLADVCGLSRDEVSACERVIDEVRERSGGEAAGKLATCLSDSESCPRAAGCLAGSGVGVLSRSLLEFVDGLRRAR